MMDTCWDGKMWSFSMIHKTCCDLLLYLLVSSIQPENIKPFHVHFFESQMTK